MTKTPQRQTLLLTPQTLQLALATKGIVAMVMGYGTITSVRAKTGMPSHTVFLWSSGFVHVGLSILIPPSKKLSLCDASPVAGSLFGQGTQRQRIAWAHFPTNVLIS